MKFVLALFLLSCLILFAAPPPPVRLYWATAGNVEVSPENIQILLAQTPLGLPSRPASMQVATTGNNTIAPSVTLYFPLNNGVNPMTWNTDVSGGTRSVMPCMTLFTNLYMVASVAPGAGACTMTLMSNGVATALSCKVTTNKTTNDVTHVVTVPAGTEVGWRLVTGAGVTSAKYCVSIETRQ